MALRSLSLCAGVGGHELALDGIARAVCYVEREAPAAALLVARMAEAALPPAPVWSDLRTFNARAWRGAVDLVVSGLPCQPYSVAGKRLGNDDERALWPEFVRVVRDCEPGLAFIECTPEFLTHAEPVWRELRGLGFEWAEPLFSTAAHYGAIHGRRRVFLLAAHPDRAGIRDAAGWIGGARWPGEAEPRDARAGAPDPDNLRRESEWCGWVLDIERQTFRHDAHRCGLRCRTRGSYWDSESPICRVDAGVPDRVDRLRGLGNSVPPQQTRAAFIELARRALT